MASSSEQRPHRTLTRTVFISRILSFFPIRSTIPSLALVSSDWDRCIYEDVGIEVYLPENCCGAWSMTMAPATFSPSSSSSSSFSPLPTTIWNGNNNNQDFDHRRYLMKIGSIVFPKRKHIEHLESALLYCMQFFKPAVHHQREKGSFQNDENDESQQTSSASSMTTTTRRKGTKKRNATTTKNVNRSSSGMMQTSSTDDMLSTFYKNNTNFYSHQQLPSESENATKVVLTRRLRVALLRAFGHSPSSASISATSSLLFPAKLSCYDEDFFCFASGSKLRVWRKKDNRLFEKRPEKDTSTNHHDDGSSIKSSIKVIPLPEFSAEFNGRYRHEDETRLKIYPCPVPHFAFLSTSSSSTLQTSLSSFLQLNLLACASPRYPNASNGIFVIDSLRPHRDTASELHLEDEVPSIGTVALHSVDRADVRQAKLSTTADCDDRDNTSSSFDYYHSTTDDFNDFDLNDELDFSDGSSAFFLNLLFQNISWTNDGRYLLAPSRSNVLVYDFATEFERRYPFAVVPSSSTSTSARDDAEEQASRLRPMNTFLFDVSNEHGGNRECYFVATTSSSSPVTKTRSTSSNRESFMAVVSSSSSHHHQKRNLNKTMTNANQILSFYDISTLHRDYREQFEEKVHEAQQQQKQLLDEKSDQLLPLRNDIILDEDKTRPEGVVSKRHLDFIDGCFCPGTYSVTKKTTVECGDPDHNNRKQEFIEEADDAHVFVALLGSTENPKLNALHPEGFLAGFTTDGVMVWSPQGIFKKNDTVNVVEKTAKKNLIFSQHNNSRSSCGESDINSDVNSVSASASSKKQQQSHASTEHFTKLAIIRDVEENCELMGENNFILAVGSDKGTIMLLKRNVFYDVTSSSSPLISYYAPDTSARTTRDFQSQPDRNDSTVGAGSSSSSSSSSYLSERHSQSLSHQHIVHDPYRGKELVDFKFVCRSSSSTSSTTSTLLLSISAASKQKCHVWLLKPGTSSSDVLNHSTGQAPRSVQDSNFYLAAVIDLQNSFLFGREKFGSGQRGSEIVSVASVPTSSCQHDCSMTANSCTTSTHEMLEVYRKKQKERMEKFPLQNKNRNAASSNDHQNNEVEKAEASTSIVVHETLLALSVKSFSSCRIVFCALVFSERGQETSGLSSSSSSHHHYHDHLREVELRIHEELDDDDDDTSNITTNRSGGGGDGCATSASAPTTIVRISIVRYNDEGNEFALKKMNRNEQDEGISDYVEVEDIFGEIRRFGIK